MNDIKQHLTHIKNGVKISYLLWLDKKNKINQNTRYSRRGSLVYGASGAGKCQLQHYFKSIKADRKDMSFESLCTTRLGNIIHEDIQSALEHIYDDYRVMCEIPVDFNLEGKKIRGHLDVAIEIDEDNVMLIDIKTLGAYPWQKVYGHLKNRAKKPQWMYKYQLATYSIGLKKNYQYKNVYMYLLNYKKDNSDMRFVEVDTDLYEKEVRYYWRQTHSLVTQLHENPKRIKELINGPVETWECKYCDYSDICPVKYVKEK